MRIKQLNKLSELSIPYIYVEGNSYERGFQYGTQARELIKRSIEIYKSIVKKWRDNITWDILKKEIKPFINGIMIYDKGLYMELEGLSEGAEISLEESVFLSARAELINPIWSRASMMEGCTSFYVDKSKTLNGEFFLGQTWDWTAVCSDLLVLLHSKDEKGHQFLSVTEAGGIGKIGVNNKGVANLLNYLNNFEINLKGATYNILLRRILDSNSLEDAQRNILRSPIAFGLNVIIADEKGSAIDYELTANGVDFFTQKEGILLHTNHFLSDKLFTRSLNKKMYPDSKNRYMIADEFLRTNNNIDIQNLIELVSYHDDERIDHNICKHNVSAEDQETAFSMIVELSNKKMYLCIGNPCCNSFYEINYNTLFYARESYL